MNWRVVGAYAGMCAIWGTTWLGIKVSLQYIPPFTGVGLRFTLAALILFTIAALRKELLPWRELPWKLVLVLGFLLFGLNYALNYIAEIELSSGLTAVLFGTLPFFSMFIGQYLIGEPTTPRILIGAVLAFGGVAVISLAGATHGSLPYAIAAIAAAAMAAFASVYAKRHSQYSPLAVLPPSMAIAGIGVGAVGLLFEHHDVARMFSTGSIGALLYLAVLGSAIAFFLNLWLIRKISVGVVNLSALIIPVIAVFVGILLGHENVAMRDILGAVLVLFGLWFALTRKPEVATAS